MMYISILYTGHDTTVLNKYYYIDSYIHGFYVMLQHREAWCAGMNGTNQCELEGERKVRQEMSVLN